MDTHIHTLQELSALGGRLGSLLAGGEVIELVGDVGAGKTTFVKTIAQGMGINDDVSSPSYTLSQTYVSPGGLRLVHYDFYRLDDPGILTHELKEVIADKHTVVAIEWGGIVTGVLPADHLRIEIVPTDETARLLRLSANGPQSSLLLEQLQ